MSIFELFLTQQMATRGLQGQNHCFYLIQNEGKRVSFKILLLALMIGILTPVYALQQPLPVEQVFQVTSEQIDAKTLAITWFIKPGYYLYRDKIHFHSDQANIESVILPQGISKQNPFLSLWPTNTNYCRFHKLKSTITQTLSKRIRILATRAIKK